MIATGISRRVSERGTGLVLCLTVVTVLLSMSGSFLAYTVYQVKASATRLLAREMDRVLDGAIAIALTRIDTDLKADRVPPPAVNGAINDGPARGTTWRVDVKRRVNVETDWKLSAVAVNGDTIRTQQVVIFRPMPLPPKPGTFVGALSSYYGFEQVKNILVTGNDVLANGVDIPPVVGTSPSDSVAISVVEGGVTFAGGSALFGGMGVPPNHTIDPNTVDPTYAGQPFPKTPLEALKINEYPPNALQFHTLADWNAFLAARGNVIPPYSFLVLDFQDGGTTMFEGINWGNTEHILIWHHENPTINNDPDAPKGDATSQNIHLGGAGAPFKGIAILDDWLHVNGSSNVRGGFISLSGMGVLEGLQGNSTVQLSTQAISRALAYAGQVQPDVPTTPRILSYREGVDDPQMRAALSALGVSVPGTPSEDGSEWYVATSVRPSL